MEKEIVCKDCGSEDIYVKITTTKNDTFVYQCEDCFIDERDRNKIDLNNGD